MIDAFLELEKLNKNTTITGHCNFDNTGCLIIQDLYDPQNFLENPPRERGKILYYENEFKFDHMPEDNFAGRALTRYNYPRYKKFHNEIKVIIEEIINCKLETTYYYDRFYFAKNNLNYHLQQNSAEISVSLHLNSNPNNIDYPLYVKTSQGNIEKVSLNQGDALLYKGCEIPCWREPLESGYSKLKQLTNKIQRKKDNTWYHQIVFNFVLSLGNRSHHSGHRGY